MKYDDILILHYDRNGNPVDIESPEARKKIEAAVEAAVMKKVGELAK